jgi:hypothetical protein
MKEADHLLEGAASASKSGSPAALRESLLVPHGRNLIFHLGGQMEEIFQGLIDRTRARLKVKGLKTIFGVKVCPAGTARQALDWKPGSRHLRMT